MAIGITSVLGSSAAVPSTGADPLARLPRLRSILAQSSQAPVSPEAFANALMEDLVRAESLTPANEIYKGRYTPKGAAQPVEMPTTQDDRDNRIINQGAYRGHQLGNGSSTISGSGCALASITMISNDLTGSKRNLVEANAQMVRAGAFAPGSSDMVLTTGAGAVDLVDMSGWTKATDRNVQEAVAKMDRKNPPMRMLAGVDYKGDSRTDHFLAIQGMGENGRLQALDPAGGRRIEFERQGDSWVEARTAGGEPYKGYKMTGFQLLAAKDSVPNRVQPLMKA